MTTWTRVQAVWLSLNLLEILIFVLTGLIILPTAHNDQRLTDFDDELDQRHRRRRIAVVISGIFIWCVQLLRTALWKTVGKSERVLLRFGLLSLSVGALWAIIVVCMLSDALALKGHCNSGCWIDRTVATCCATHAMVSFLSAFALLSTIEEVYIAVQYFGVGLSYQTLLQRRQYSIGRSQGQGANSSDIVIELQHFDMRAECR